MNNRSDNQNHYEEYWETSTRKTWIFLSLFSLLILGWGMLLMCMVMDTPREWSFWVFPDTPGESVFSTVTVDAGAKPGQQIAPLPGSSLTDSAGAAP